MASTSCWCEEQSLLQFPGPMPTTRSRLLSSATSFCFVSLRYCVSTVNCQLSIIMLVLLDNSDETLDLTPLLCPKKSGISAKQNAKMTTRLRLGVVFTTGYKYRYSYQHQVSTSVQVSADLSTYGTYSHVATSPLVSKSSAHVGKKLSSSCVG